MYDDDGCISKNSPMLSKLGWCASLISLLQAYICDLFRVLITISDVYHYHFAITYIIIMPFVIAILLLCKQNDLWIDIQCVSRSTAGAIYSYIVVYSHACIFYYVTITIMDVEYLYSIRHTDTFLYFLWNEIDIIPSVCVHSEIFFYINR